MRRKSPALNHIGSIQPKICLLEICQKLRKTLRRESCGSTLFTRSSEVLQKSSCPKFKYSLSRISHFTHLATSLVCITRWCAEVYTKPHANITGSVKALGPTASTYPILAGVFQNYATLLQSGNQTGVWCPHRCKDAYTDDRWKGQREVLNYIHPSLSSPLRSSCWALWFRCSKSNSFNPLRLIARMVVVWDDDWNFGHFLY